MSQVIQNAFTVDVEDYFQVSGFERHVDRETWASYESRVEGNTDRILDLLSERDVRGTFFILGWVAERHPEMVRKISSAGHELGSHSFWHRLIYQQTPDEFREDLRRSRDVLEDITGQRVTCYRAPSFSITRDSLWSLEILIEEGFEVDSSVYPIYHDRYGIPNAQRWLHQLATPSGTLWEFPPSVVRRAGVNLPVSGGGYFRLYPLQWTDLCLRAINARHGQPFMFYIHPWEIDPKQPRLKAGDRIARWRHYLNLNTTEGKLASLLSRFPFTTMKEVVAAQHAAADGTIKAETFDDMGEDVAPEESGFASGDLVEPSPDWPASSGHP
ncbi:MAG: XrtA system polysaccharide deacetylase [Pirellulales bacterium]